MKLRSLQFKEVMKGGDVLFHDEWFKKLAVGWLPWSLQSNLCPICEGCLYNVVNSIGSVEHIHLTDIVEIREG